MQTKLELLLESIQERKSSVIAQPKDLFVVPAAQRHQLRRFIVFVLMGQ